MLTTCKELALLAKKMDLSRRPFDERADDQQDDEEQHDQVDEPNPLSVLRLRDKLFFCTEFFRAETTPVVRERTLHRVDTFTHRFTVRGIHLELPIRVLRYLWHHRF